MCFDELDSLLKSEMFALDYNVVNGKDDMEWLTEHGHSIPLGYDGSACVVGLNNLSPSSYGKIGTLYAGLFKEEKVNGYDKSTSVFLEMMNEGIVAPLRIRTFKSGAEYWYSFEDSKWTNMNTREECDNPFTKKK